MKRYEDPVFRLMSEKAKEIQEGWIPQVGDYIYSIYESKIKFVSDEFNYWTYYKRIKEYQIVKNGRETYANKWYKVIYLPRQDQLQGMVQPEKDNNWCKRTFVLGIKPFNNLVGDIAIQNCLDKVGDSMEQLWLAFVMKEKYNKEWDGEDWVECIS